MCRMKVRYSTEEKAEGALFSARSSTPAFWNADIYRCPFCHTYHIGTINSRPVFRIA